VRAEETTSLGALALQQRPIRDVSADELQGAMLAAVRTNGLSLLHWTPDAEEVRARLAFLHLLQPDEWPAVSDDALLATLDEWLVPFLTGDGNALRRVDVTEALLARVGWERRRMMDALAPTHMPVPSGSRIRVDYSDPAAPVLAVRLQEMFGLADTPRIADGRVPLMLHLLSPAHRPVQVTRDLASFWRTAYFDVRRDLRGRYPKHYWPENPLEAEATRRAKPRGG
jgi:ATP-dependent helicase HrpB